VVTFVVVFARDLSFNFFGWPFSQMGAQGSLVIYVAIIWFYARYMNNLDNEHGVAEVGGIIMAGLSSTASGGMHGADFKKKQLIDKPPGTQAALCL
jgi:putative solute:sodium symporter small subunit